MTAPNLSASLLRTLHRIHRQLGDLKERLARGPKQLRAAEANVAYRDEQLVKLRADLKAMRMAADAKQLQLKSGEAKILDLKRKLNAASSNREYQALRDQIAADEMANSVLADEIIEALEQIDQFHAKIAEAESTAAGAREKAREVSAEVGRQKPLIEGDLRRLEAELRESEAALPGEIRDLYHRVVRQKGVDALAAVENDCCTGCNQQVPLNIFSKMTMNEPMFCRTCGRLLYIAGDKADN